MPRSPRSKKKMFRVVVLAGVSLTACSSGVALPSSDGGSSGSSGSSGDPGSSGGVVTTNPPGVPLEAGTVDAKAPTDAHGDEMPIIK